MVDATVFLSLFTPCPLLDFTFIGQSSSVESIHFCCWLPPPLPPSTTKLSSLIDMRPCIVIWLSEMLLLPLLQFSPKKKKETVKVAVVALSELCFVASAPASAVTAYYQTADCLTLSTVYLLCLMMGHSLLSYYHYLYYYYSKFDSTTTNFSSNTWK